MRKVKGADLRAMRTFAGKTTTSMAHAAGVRTRKTYENWEKDVGTPNVNQFFQLVEACGLNAEGYLQLIDLKAGGSQDSRGL